MLTPSLSELCELVGLSVMSAGVPCSAMASVSECQVFKSKQVAVDALSGPSPVAVLNIN
jgi:hypothetical protein